MSNKYTERAIVASALLQLRDSAGEPAEVLSPVYAADLYERIARYIESLERAPGWVATSEGEPDAFERWLIELEAYAEDLQMAAPYRSEEYNMRMGERGALSDAREAYRRFRATGTPEHEDTRPTAAGGGGGEMSEPLETRMSAGNIYVVMGVAGEYSDRTEWPVVAFHDEAAAKRYVTLAQDEAKRLESARQEARDSDDADAESRSYDDEQWPNRYDARMDWYGYEAARYWYYIAPIGDAVPVA